MKNHPHDNIYSILAKLDALKPTPAEERFALVKEIRESVEAQGLVLEGVSAVEAKLARQFAESQVNEKAVSQAQQKFMGMVHAAQKGEKAASPEVAKVAKSMGKKDARDFAATKHKGLPQHVSEKYDPVKAVKQCAMDYMEMSGLTSVDQLEAEDIEYIGGECQMNYQDVCEILGCELPDSLGPVKSWDTDEHGNKFDLEEDTCNECGMYESACSCEHDNKEQMDENGLQYYTGVKKHGKEYMEKAAAAGREGASQKELGALKDRYSKAYKNKEVEEGITTHRAGVTRHTKTDYPGYPTDDLEKDDDDRTGPKSIGGRGRPRKAQTKNRRPVAGAEKKSRGRPSKHPMAKSVSMPHDPFGRVSSIPKGKRGTIHTMSESIMESVNFKRMMEEQHMTLEEMLECMNTDMMQFKESGVCSDRLRDMMEVYSHAKRQMEETQQPAPVVPRGIPGNIPIPGKMDRLNQRGPDYMEETDPLEEELSKLAELAGIRMADEGAGVMHFKKQQAEKAGKDSFELGGKEFPVDESEMEEGNAFGKAVRDAKADGVQPGEKITVGGKEYAVREAQELVAMLRVAGLDTKQLEEALAKNKATYGDTEVDGNDEEVEEELANAPDEEYMSMKASTLNPGEADSGEKQMNPDRPTFKNGDNALAKPPVRESVVELESKLAAEYESIKKVS